MQRITRIFLTILAMTFCGGVLAAGTLPSEIDATRIEMEDSVFRSVPVTLIDSGAELKAEFMAPSGWFDFTSTTKATGEVAVSATVSIDGLVTRLEAVVAADRQSVVWTGNGGSLTKASRDAIRRLLLALEPMLQNHALLPHQEWAFRLTNLWSEVPLYLPLAKPRTVRASRDNRSISGLSEPTVQPQESAVIQEFEDLNAAAATCGSGCNVSGGDGKTYLRGSCTDCGCALGTYSTKHDACVAGIGHCYNSFSVQGGCSRTKNCAGRCGPGCGLTGGGPYTKDCLEHDHCVAHDSAAACCANDPKCGDEFFEAEDDFLFAVFNCRGCS
jgi:hypothetical protein